MDKLIYFYFLWEKNPTREIYVDKSRNILKNISSILVLKMVQESSAMVPNDEGNQIKNKMGRAFCMHGRN
jgi:hypothetical protein